VADKEATPQELIAGAMRYAAARMGQDHEYTKSPAAWLRDGCWRDEPSPPYQPPRGSKEDRRRRTAEALDKLDAYIERHEAGGIGNEDGGEIIDIAHGNALVATVPQQPAAYQDPFRQLRLRSEELFCWEATDIRGDLLKVMRADVGRALAVLETAATQDNPREYIYRIINPQRGRR
jgi:hypothetical protein